MRLNANERVLAKVEIINVLARPGTPSRMQWPRLKSAISNSSMTWSWPTMTFAICVLISLNASRNRRIASRSSWPRFSSTACSVGLTILGENAASLMRLSILLSLAAALGAAGAAGAPPQGRRLNRKSPLINGQRRFVQLQDGQIHRRDEHGADHADGPAAVA